MSLFNNIRQHKEKNSYSKQCINTILILLLGIILGIISKFLDTTFDNELPFIFEYLDIKNFLGRFSIWILIALCISIYSNSPIRAGINVLIFFIGMVASYYIYSTYIVGFYPSSYAMIWYKFTALSPILAFICWYAKGTSKISAILSALIISVLFNLTFVYGWLYFEARSILELLLFFVGIIILKRKTIKESIIVLISGITFAFCINLFFPFQYW